MQKLKSIELINLGLALIALCVSGAQYFVSYSERRGPDNPAVYQKKLDDFISLSAHDNELAETILSECEFHRSRLNADDTSIYKALILAERDKIESIKSLAVRTRPMWSLSAQTRIGALQVDVEDDELQIDVREQATKIPSHAKFARPSDKMNVNNLLSTLKAANNAEQAMAHELALEPPISGVLTLLSAPSSALRPRASDSRAASGAC